MASCILLSLSYAKNWNATFLGLGLRENYYRNCWCIDSSLRGAAELRCLSLMNPIISLLTCSENCSSLSLLCQPPLSAVTHLLYLWLVFLYLLIAELGQFLQQFLPHWRNFFNWWKSLYYRSSTWARAVITYPRTGHGNTLVCWSCCENQLNTMYFSA